MDLLKLIPLVTCVCLGCNPAPKYSQKPTPVTTRSSTADARAFGRERQEERRMPCSAEWLKNATEVERKNCLDQSSINQAMNALSTRPLSTKKPPSTSTTKQ